ncbi:hypothetical protein [Flavobacterium aciduliphilum]|uniref:hypothetical protein n=1 Tax=Flavobacterium aciduliphilum TaxID=1101402 RepID=UPI0011BF605E|nr:hypothetical protein [Flavobacterium aciduliphilum]
MFRSLLLLFLLSVSVQVEAQNAVFSNRINGKVIADYNDLEGIYIINLANENSTSTERGGYFSIVAKVGDTLLFSAIQFKALKVAVKENDDTHALFFVKMEPLVRMIDEVRIGEYKNINAVSLGIISPNIKHFTPAERKLNTASNAYPSLGIGTKIGVSAGLDPLLNWMSGRTTILKKELEVEKKETLIDKVQNWFEEKYLVEKLKIPQDYVKGFLYFVVEDEKFVAAVKSKNRTMATFVLNDLAVKYKQIITEK